MTDRTKPPSIRAGISRLALLAAALTAAPAAAQQPPHFVGEIRAFAGYFAPRGWAFCDGQTADPNVLRELFQAIGTTYGGDGNRTFRLPDLRGRIAVGAGPVPGGNTRRVGQHGGQEDVALQARHLPNHTHHAALEVRGTDATAGSESAAGGLLAVTDAPHYLETDADVPMAGDGTPITVSSTGGGESHERLPPQLVVNYIIAVDPY